MVLSDNSTSERAEWGWGAVQSPAPSLPIVLLPMTTAQPAPRLACQCWKNLQQSQWVLETAVTAGDSFSLSRLTTEVQGTENENPCSYFL